MKLFRYYFAFICISACSSQRQNFVPQIPPISSLREHYHVYRIDSTMKIFLIYARKDSSIYKIVSMKDTTDCRNIEVGKAYPFSLFSLVPKEFNGVNISPNSVPHVSGIDFHGEFVVFGRDSVRDIHAAINVKGLCFK